VNALLIVFLIFRLGVTIGYWKLFEKAGIDGWKSLIPIYSEYVIMTEIVGKPKWWIIYLLIPFVNIFAYYILIFNLLRCFGKETLLGQILTIFAAFLYLPYLGFNKDVKYLGKLETLPEIKKTPVQEWADAIIFAVVAATMIRWLIMEAYTIPTPSMENSLLVGDFLFVSKFHYGTRTTTTPLQIPLTHQKIWFTEIPSYSNLIRLPQYRLPGLTTIKNGDVVVFNVPPRELNEGFDYPVDLKTNYIKRCVGIPGDMLVVKDQEVIINGTPLPHPPEMQYSYLFLANGQINDRNFRKLGLGPEDYNPAYQTNEGKVAYHVFLTDEAYQQIAKNKPSYIQSITKEHKIENDVFPYSGYNGRYGNQKNANMLWTQDNFGPLWIPKKGATIPVNDSTLTLYGNTIVTYDHNDDAKIENGKLFIDGKELSEYTFKQNYYFMMGDNRHNSLDSRYWGFVPEDHVVGKGFFIWLSIDQNADFIHKIRWSRFFKLIR
jgi:signal peptidase I